MTDNHRNSVNDGADPLVSGEYHKLAIEAAPDELNHAVLNAARKATGQRAFEGWRGSWFRPLTTVVVIALSLAVVLEFNDANNVDESMSTAEDVFREASDLAADQIREAEAAASRAMQNAPSDVRPPVDAATAFDPPSLSPVERGCDEQQRSSMASWWSCVESLHNRGASALAEQELVALLRSYPAFVEPKP